jgi:hypothetical protein
MCTTRANINDSVFSKFGHLGNAHWSAQSREPASRPSKRGSTMVWLSHWAVGLPWPSGGAGGRRWQKWSGRAKVPTQAVAPAQRQRASMTGQVLHVGSVPTFWVAGLKRCKSAAQSVVWACFPSLQALQQRLDYSEQTVQADQYPFWQTGGSICRQSPHSVSCEPLQAHRCAHRMAAFA